MISYLGGLRGLEDRDMHLVHSLGSPTRSGGVQRRGELSRGRSNIGTIPVDNQLVDLAIGTGIMRNVYAR